MTTNTTASLSTVSSTEQWNFDEQTSDLPRWSSLCISPQIRSPLSVISEARVSDGTEHHGQILKPDMREFVWYRTQASPICVGL